jgi:hypothetical protein
MQKNFYKDSTANNGYYRVLSSGVVILVLIFMVISAQNQAIYLPDNHLDGAFQTASSLFRLAAGQRPGQDFLPYLGIGPLLLLYPLFTLLGSDLAASMAAAYLMTWLCSWFVISVLFHLILMPKYRLSSVMAAGFLVCCMILLWRFGTISSLSYVLEPGNSLRPIRSFIPYLLALPLGWVIRHHPDYRSAIVAGGCAGMVLMWSNDYAIMSAGLFSLAYGLSVLRVGWSRSELLKIATFTMSALITAILLFWLVTSGHIIRLWHYNFVDVLGDQWWFFTPYTPQLRIMDWTELTKLLSQETYFPLVILGFLIVRFICKPTHNDFLVIWIAFVLVLGGALATIGGHMGFYFRPFMYWGVVVLFLYVIRYVRQALYHTMLTDCLNGLLCVAALVGSLCLVAYSGRDYQRHLTHAKQDANAFYVAELGGYLHKKWYGYIEYAKAHPHLKVTEEYWGLWSAFHKTFPLWPVDSIIHALGGVRRDAASWVVKSDIIISTHYQLSPRWQSWSVSQNGWFYDELFTNWYIDYRSPNTLLWRRRVDGGSAYYPSRDCLVDPNNQSIRLKDKESGFYKIYLRYVIEASGRHLVLFQNNIADARTMAGYASLPIHDDRIMLFVYVPPNGDNGFDIKPISLHTMNVQIESCSAQKLVEPDHDVLRGLSLDQIIMKNL